MNDTVFKNPELTASAIHVLQLARDNRVKIVTAESCTGGLIAGLLTEIAGSSDVFERGYVTYSNDAKIECLGVDPRLIETEGAVSREVAIAMAAGALSSSRADVSIAVTGIAGPGGGTLHKPVGLVHLAAHRKNHPTRHKECRFGDIGRAGIRIATIREALVMLEQAVSMH